MNLLSKKEVQILGMKHKVQYYDEPSTSNSTMGTSDCKHGIIKLCKNMPPDIIEQTMLHEVIHLISENLGLGLKESQVLSLAAGLYSFFKENKL